MELMVLDNELIVVAGSTVRPVMVDAWTFNNETTSILHFMLIRVKRDFSVVIIRINAEFALC